jgi:transposase
MKNHQTFSNASYPADPASLPDDPQTLREMVLDLAKELRARDSLVAHLQHQLEKQLRHRFGRRSETLTWENGLFPQEVIDAMLAGVASGAIPAVKETIWYERNKPVKPGHGRQTLPDHLPRVREEIDLPETEKVCSVCKTPKTRIREEVTEQLEYIPASLFVKQIVRPVYACPQRCEISVAPKPSSPIEKGLAGPGLLTQIAISKYADHLPLNRQEDIFSRHGVHISRSTQCGWMRQTAQLLYLLYAQLRSAVLAAKVIHTDDTPIEVQEKKKTRKGRVWIYEDPRRRLAVFDYTPNRGRDGPKKFLGNFSGYLQADAYAGYDCIYANKTVIEVACWAHARRKFYDARTVQPEAALAAVAWIKQLYDVEKLAKSYRDYLDVSLAEEARYDLYAKRRYELRQEHSRGLLKSFDEWLTRQAEVILPKSPVGQAIAYTRANWQALNVYATNGELSIDNNLAELAMRHAVVGRANWLFFGSDQGGGTWAVITSLLYSAKLHKLNLFVYLKDILTRIGDTPVSEMEQFLPDVWKREHASVTTTGQEPHPPAEETLAPAAVSDPTEA